MGNKGLLFKDLSGKDVDALLRLQDEVFATLENPEYLLRNTREAFELCVREPNWTFGAFDPDSPERLVGAAIMFDPGDGEENMGGRLVCHRASRAVNDRLAMILPEFRGRGFQRSVLTRMKERALGRGYDGICASVHPLNIHSKQNIIACGFEYDHTEKEYGGIGREVYFLKLSQ